MDINQVHQFLDNDATENDLYDILGRVQELIENYAKREFPDALGEALARAEVAAEQVDRVVFPTLEYDDGFYFYREAEVHYRDGTSEKIDLAEKAPSFDAMLAEMTRVARRDGALQSWHTLAVSFPDMTINY